MLVTEGALFELTADEALQVVSYMHPRRFPAGTVLIREGESGDEQAMAVILSGEVSVENETPSDSIVVTVLGPGGLLGELALIDEGPRSATCTSISSVEAAVLSREALAALLEEKPGVAARLLMAIGKRVGDRLRDTNRRLMALTRVSKAMEEELDATHAVNRRLMRQIEELQKERGGAQLPQLDKLDAPRPNEGGSADNPPKDLQSPGLVDSLLEADPIDHDASTMAPSKYRTLIQNAVTMPPTIL